METASLLVLSALFAYLAVDAGQLEIDPNQLPYEAVSGDAAESLIGQSRAEIDNRKWWALRYGEQDFRGTSKFWWLASVASLCGAVWTFAR